MKAKHTELGTDYRCHLPTGVQNTCACIVTKTSRQDHVVLMELHRFPSGSFTKIRLHVFEAIHRETMHSFVNCCLLANLSARLGWRQQSFLDHTRTCTYGYRLLAKSAAVLMNNVLEILWNISNIATFQ